MYLGGEKIPQQKLPLSKKNKKWREACVEAFIDLSNQGVSKRRDYIKSLYDYYNGVIEKDDYRYVTDPYGKSRNNFPSKMRNYPIIKPIIDLLLGEKSKRPLNYTVAVLNEDVVSEKEKAKQELLTANLQQQFANKMIQMGIAPEQMEEQGVQMPEDLLKSFERSYVDNRAIIGQKSMNYILQAEEVYDKIQKAWFHYLISGEAYTERGVQNGEPFYDVLNPLDVDYDKDPDLDFVEDGDWALVRKYVHVSTVVDHYHDVLTPEQILELEEPRQSDIDSYLLYKKAETSKDENAYRNRLLEVVKIYWKSRKRIGFLTYLDPTTGAMEEMEVDESFKMTADMRAMGAKIDYTWVNEVWEGTRIDGRMYVNINPMSNQRVSMNNPSKCKLPINGRRYSDINSTNISLVSLGIPYQLNYNIYKYRLELAIARSKDIIAQFDINMIPKKWDMDKFMYYVEGTGIAWVDYNKEGIQLNPQHQSVLDMSIKTIQQYITLLESILNEWEKLSGVNRQRQGSVGQYEGKGSTQQAIVQSSHITEDMFRKFEHLEQRDLQALLDYSKEAWLTGKNGAYVMPDGTVEYLSVDPLSHIESDYGIFVTNSGKEKEKIDTIRQMAQSMIQNGMPASSMADMLESESFTEIKHNLKEAEASMQELQQQQQQAEAEAKQQSEQMQAQLKQQELDNDNQNKDLDRKNKIDIAMIQAGMTEQAATFNLEKSIKEQDIKRAEVDIKSKEADEKSRANRADEEIKRQAIKEKKNS
tara:strand:- start:14645 stop:16912 length:2268 start_codon:yes stop_codon:yes gene_type:complete